MFRSTQFLLLSAVAAALLAGCYGPAPRPFAAGGRSLDEPPRYGDPNRYVEPIAPGPAEGPMGPPLPPVPTPELDPATGQPAVDPGLTVTPPVPGGVATPPASVTPPAPVAPPSVRSGAPPESQVPFARAVPGRPGFVYNPKNPKEEIDVSGVAKGKRAAVNYNGEIIYFRVPF